MEILTHPNPALKQIAAAVDPATDADLESLVRRMAQAMYDAPGIGLAAPQVGVLKRVITYDLEDGLRVLCNPQIVEHSDETAVDEEGCLSLPGISIDIPRPLEIRCVGQNMKGKSVEFRAEGLHARLIQHEIDHLDGVLLFDRAEPEERMAALRRYAEAREDSP